MYRRLLHVLEVTVCLNVDSLFRSTELYEVESGHIFEFVLLLSCLLHKIKADHELASFSDFFFVEFVISNLFSGPVRVCNGDIKVIGRQTQSFVKIDNLGDDTVRFLVQVMLYYWFFNVVVFVWCKASWLCQKVEDF